VLGPFDYSAENYTGLLWAMEGITEYYTFSSLRRAGLITTERYLEILGELMSEQAEAPGRHLQSLEEASFDAWIKYYRPDEHSVNSSISYYRKGALASWLLDLELRRRSRGTRSLDDLMLLLWERYGLTGVGIPEDGYERAVAEIVPGQWGPFFDHAIRGRGDLNYDPGLAAMGLQVDWHADPQAPGTWLGLQTRADNGRLKVTSVLSDGPAWGSGLSGGDEIIALDGFRVDESNLSDRLRDYQSGDTVTLATFQRDELVQIPITLAPRPATRATLRRVSRPSVLQRSLFEDWTREINPSSSAAK
jgi:predicted metalloprotease with PDZ domain